MGSLAIGGIDMRPWLTTAAMALGLVVLVAVRVLILNTFVLGREFPRRMKAMLIALCATADVYIGAPSVALAFPSASTPSSSAVLSQHLPNPALGSAAQQVSLLAAVA